MAQCRFCDKYIPDGVVQCPHCQASLQASATEKGGTISPFEIRARALQERRQPPARGAAGRLPASRLALFGCLGLIVLSAAVALVGVIVAPDKARYLVYGTPTSTPRPPRPTLTPTPIFTPTPKWPSYTGTEDNFTVDFPEYWVIIDYTDPYWEKRLDHKTNWYSWLGRELPEEKRQVEAETLGVRAFDPHRLGHFSVHCRPEPDLAGLTVNELQNQVGRALQRQGHRNVKSYDIEIDDRPAALFEFVETSESETQSDQALTVQLYIVTDDQQGYWIEVVGLEDELARDSRAVEAIVNSFRIVSSSGQQSG